MVSEQHFHLNKISVTGPRVLRGIKNLITFMQMTYNSDVIVEYITLYRDNLTYIIVQFVL